MAKVTVKIEVELSDGRNSNATKRVIEKMTKCLVTTLEGYEQQGVPFGMDEDGFEVYIRAAKLAK